MTSQELNHKIQNHLAQDEERISLIDVFTLIGEEKKTIFWIVFVCTLAALCISLVLPNIYTAKTTFLPPQQNQSAAASALSSLGGLAGLAGGTFGIVKSPDEMYVMFLQSETLQNALIGRFKLQELYKVERLSDARNILQKNTKINADKKSGIISIEVNDKSPVMAASLANAYIEELHKLLDHLAVTDAQQRRMFFEKLITQTKEALANAELASMKAQEKSGIVSLDAQTTLAIKASAELRTQIALREVRLRAMSAYATSQNADVQRVTAELASLHAQLEKLEQGSGQQNHSNDKSVDALANLRAFREVKYQEAVLESLIKQYELARVEEAKEGPLVQQIDIAVPPEKKSKPKRAIIVLASAFGSLIFGLLIIFLKRGLAMAAYDPSWNGKIEAMRKAWNLK